MLLGTSVTRPTMRSRPCECSFQRIRRGSRTPLGRMVPFALDIPCCLWRCRSRGDATTGVGWIAVRSRSLSISRRTQEGFALEDRSGDASPIDNRTVLYLLDAVQIFQGRTLSYLALDVEQIGYVYEGLLERTVVRAKEVTLDLDATKNAKNPWCLCRSLTTRLQQVAMPSRSCSRNRLAVPQAASGTIWTGQSMNMPRTNS